MTHPHPPDENEHILPPDGNAQPATDAGDEAEAPRAEAQVAAALEEVLRTRAEMDNLRKRVARETETIRRFAGERILADLLPVLDSIEQGLAIVEEGPAREGLELTRKQLADVLERHGLVVIDPAGQPFDPAGHQAISMQPSDTHPENTVVAVLQRGYRLHDRVLRPAMVIVSTAAGGA